MNDFFTKIHDRFRALRKRTQRRLVIAGYVAVFSVLVVAIGFSYRSPSQIDTADSVDSIIAMQAVQRSLAPNSNAYIDQVTEADLAYSVAETAGLPVANNVMERSVSLATKSQLSQTDDQSINKPIISLTDDNGAFTSYITVEGDDVNSLAAKFALSPQTIKWVNNLIGDTITVGTTLAIPSVDGIAYIAKEGDNLDSLVEKYGSNASQIMAVNGIDELRLGERILIPGGILPENERPGYSAYTPVSNSYASNYYAVSSANATAMAGNRYSYGYCTWYAYNRRAQLGRPIGSFWGNANTWDSNARAGGWTVSGIPVPGAVFQTRAGYYGHVGIVESVNPDGTINISDMNGIAGWNRVGYQSNVDPGRYVYIY